MSARRHAAPRGILRTLAGLREGQRVATYVLVHGGGHGMVITGAADRVTDRAGHLVYLDAATPVDGQSLVDQAPEMMGGGTRREPHR